MVVLALLAVLGETSLGIFVVVYVISSVGEWLLYDGEQSTKNEGQPTPKTRLMAMWAACKLIIWVVLITVAILNGRAAPNTAWTLAAFFLAMASDLIQVISAAVLYYASCLGPESRFYYIYLICYVSVDSLLHKILVPCFLFAALKY